MRIGLFGGTFDPPHDGHLHVARTAMRRLDLHRVWWLVSPQNPIKARRAGDFMRRFEAAQALADEPGMVVSDIERRLGVTRTIDLVTALKQRNPGVDFVWIMGADNLKSFHRWHRWRALMTALPVAVIARPTDSLRARLAPAAREFAQSRISDRCAHALPVSRAPAWTYLNERLNSSSSTALRADQS
jgi:nicotinate-nucleotide adenylyltransferase